MVIQTIKENDRVIDIINLPEMGQNRKNLVENDRLIPIGFDIGELGDKVELTANGLMSMTQELKHQLIEIEKLEETMVSMHQVITLQNERILELEEKLEKI